MKNQIPAIVLAFACTVLAFALYYSRQENTSLRREIASLTALWDQISTPSAVPEKSGSEAPLPENEAAKAAVLTTVPDVNEDDPAGRRIMSSMAKMMENPAMNKMMEASQRGAVGALYSDLIEYLKLNAEETDYFMDLLMYRQMKQMDLAVKVMSGNLSEEEKQQMTAEMKAAAELVKTEMKAFLNNDEDYAEFEFYEQTMGERMMLSQMDQRLAGTDASLSDETYRELLGMMHHEREAFPFSSDLSDQEKMDLGPERFSKENLDRFAQDNEALYRIIIGKAQSLLTPEQLKAFEEAINTAIEMQRAQLEMATRMFGGSEAPEAP